MEWKFTIIDRDGIETVILDPAGWDSASSEISRDLDMHGIVFVNGGDTFEFRGLARQLLMAEYDEYGIEGIMFLRMDQACSTREGLVDQDLLAENALNLLTQASDNILVEQSAVGQSASYIEYLTAKFDFGKYRSVCGDDCYVKIPVENTDDAMTLRNRINQKVNLQTLVAFDETTALAPYDKLPFPTLLPSKGILIQNLFENKLADNGTPVAGVPVNDNPGGFANSETGMIEVGMDSQIAGEIGNSSTNLQPLYSCVLTAAGTLGCAALNRFTLSGSGYDIAPLNITAICNYQEGTPNYGQVSDSVDVDINLPGHVKFNNPGKAAIVFIVATLPAGNVGDQYSDYIFHLIDYVYGSAGSTPDVITDQVVDISSTYTNPAFVLNQGDRVYAFFAIYNYVDNDDNTGGAFSVSFDLGSYIRMKTLSHTPASYAKTFMINEAISRIVEAITNDRVRAYSEYFGRTDSQPYSHASDGCGSLETITDGLRIRRQENKVPGQTTVFAESLQGVFEGLNPIHNIGMGLEDDPARDGLQRLRVESWEHFYQDELIMSCIGVNKIERRTIEKEIFSTWQFGFSKWEAEEYNGLDEFLTKRISRTMLQQVKNELTKLTKYIGSGYAWEITRRKGNENSKDWRYDKETFIVCLKRGITLTNCSFVEDTSTSIYVVNGLGMTFEFLTEFYTVGKTISVSNGLVDLGTFTILTATPVFSNGGLQLTFVEVIPTGWTTGIFEVIDAEYLSVELGNVDNESNIIDPPTIYNWRIRPVYNAMRWMNKVLSSYRKFDSNAKIVFTDGDGNYFAEGKMISTECRLEEDAIAENDTLSPDSFADQDDARPFLHPERVEFQYPMTVADYKRIKAKPYGKIYFESDCEEGYGWIDKIKYQSEAGMGTFLLIPKITA